MKSIPTTAAPGSGYLFFDWSWVNVSGVVSASPSATLSGSAGGGDVAFGHGRGGAREEFGGGGSSLSPGTGSLTPSFPPPGVGDKNSPPHAHFPPANTPVGR